MLLVSSTPPGVTPESFQLVLHVSDSASSNLRPAWLLNSRNGQFLRATPWRPSILINEWVSLWAHCTVWGLGLHHSHQFLSHLRKPKLAGRSLVPFLQSKGLMYFPHFYSDKFYKSNQIEEKCQISLLLNKSAKTIQSPTTERPQHLSVGPRVFLDFFSQSSPPTQYLSSGWEILASFSQPPTQYLWVGISQYLSTEPHSVSRP